MERKITIIRLDEQTRIDDIIFDWKDKNIDQLTKKSLKSKFYETKLGIFSIRKFGDFKDMTNEELKKLGLKDICVKKIREVIDNYNKIKNKENNPLTK